MGGVLRPSPRLEGAAQKTPGREARAVLTSLKCLVVFMMYGVRSFFSSFIQPCPKNSLERGGDTPRTRLGGLRISPLLSVLGEWLSAAGGAGTHAHSLVGDGLEDKVVQQGQLLGNLQG